MGVLATRVGVLLTCVRVLLTRVGVLLTRVRVLLTRVRVLLTLVSYKFVLNEGYGYKKAALRLGIRGLLWFKIRGCYFALTAII